jgi:TolA-binding protein
MVTHRNWTAAFALLPLLAVACSSAAKRDSQNPDQLAEIKAQLAELKASMTTVGTRVDSLEGKLSSMNQKFDNTRSSMEDALETVHPKVDPVVAHPAEGVGSRIEPSQALSDPEVGFVDDDAVKAYRKAMMLLQSRKFPEAMLAFSSFLETYPDHALAGAAQFHVGESYLRQKEYKLALQEFRRVLTSYDRSSYVAQTLLDMVAAETALKLPEDAARHRQLLTSLFPQSPPAKFASESSRDVVNPGHTEDELPTPPGAIDAKPAETGRKAAEVDVVPSTVVRHLDEAPEAGRVDAPPTAPAEPGKK